MAEQQETKRNRSANTSTEGPVPAAFARQKLPARFVDDVSNISIYPNGACRLRILTCTTDNEDQARRLDTELILVCAILNTLVEALPEALAQAEASRCQRDSTGAAIAAGTMGNGKDVPTWNADCAWSTDDNAAPFRVDGAHHDPIQPQCAGGCTAKGAAASGQGSAFH